MKTKFLMKKAGVIILFLILCVVTITPALGTTSTPSNSMYYTQKNTNQEYSLPPPTTTDIELEKTIFSRKSVRNFTEDTISDQELSTILWAAYGLRLDGTHTVPGIEENYGVVIYVLKEDAVYTYNPINHSLVFYKAGDWRDVVGWQYSAPIQLAMCYDTDKIDRLSAGAQIGMVDQNIQLMAYALNLGTVVTAQIPPATNPMGLPDNHEGFTVMPIGHPEYDPYQFIYRPLWFSFLPRIKVSEMSLSTALETRQEATSFEGTLTRQQISQIIWATSGFSYYVDKSEEIYHKGRHRTIPSGKGYYPVDIYAVKKTGIFKYYPNIVSKINSVPVDFIGLPIVTFLLPVKLGDHRDTIAEACLESSIESAPLCILFVLDREKTRPPGQPDLSGDQFLHTWYHDAGAGAHNVMLEAAAWGLNANFFNIEDQQAIIELLKLNEESTIPIFAMPVGQ